MPLAEEPGSSAASAETITRERGVGRTLTADFFAGDAAVRCAVARMVAICENVHVADILICVSARMRRMETTRARQRQVKPQTRASEREGIFDARVDEVNADATMRQSDASLWRGKRAYLSNARV